MPILDIELVGHGSTGPYLATRIADAVSPILAPGRRGATWVRLRHLHGPQGDYGENGWDPEQTPEPVFVRLLVASWPDEAARGALSDRLAEAIGDSCRRPKATVHILWEPPAAGRIAFGGRLVPSDATSSFAIE